MTLLECINGPEDLKGLSQDQLTRLAGEIRDLLIETTVKDSAATWARTSAWSSSRSRSTGSSTRPRTRSSSTPATRRTCTSC